MSISSLISRIITNPDDPDNFCRLYNATLNTPAHDWLYGQNYFLSLRPEALECIALIIKKQRLSWYDHSLSASPFGLIENPSIVWLSRLHFGIKGANGWDLCTRINTPELSDELSHCSDQIDEALVVCEQSASNYGHFQLVTMARIYDIYIRNNYSLPTRNIVIDDPLCSFAKELVEIHPLFRSLRYIAARGKPLQINKRAYIPNFKRLGTKAEARILDSMWRNVSVRHYSFIEKRIYIERRTSANGSAQRKIINTGDRDRWLRRNRFKLMYMEDISVNDKISLFRSAEYVVAVEGAALVNICHMEPGTRVVELHHIRRHDPTFEEIGRIRKLVYTRMSCASALSHLQEQNLLASGWHYHMFPLICNFEKLSTVLELKQTLY